MTNKFLFLFSDSTIIRKDNNLYIQTGEEQKRPFPIKVIEAIYCIGKIQIDSYTLSFLMAQNIAIHFFGYRHSYAGTCFPESPQQINKSGFVLLQQVRAFDDEKHRLYIAKKITEGHLSNMYNNIKTVMDKNTLTETMNALEKATSIKETMGIEGNFKKLYYAHWNLIIKNQRSFKFTIRTKRPPADKINALISFVNTFIYSFVLNEIYKTELDPRIGFLHEPNYKHLSLHLDIAEIFKPIIGDRLIFSLLNKEEITAKSFTTNNKQIRLTIEAKQKIISSLLNKMEDITTINTQKMNYYKIIRREVNQIKKTVVEYSDYTPFIKE